MSTISTSTKDSIKRSFSLTKTAWVIDQPRWLVEQWLDQGVFDNYMVFRVDTGMDRPQVRFTEGGIGHAMNKVLSERLKCAPNTMSEDEFNKWIHDFMHSMFARLDQIR